MPIGFESGDDFDRMANAVKGYEGMTGGPHPDPRSATPNHTHNRVSVRVTNTTPDADGWYSATLVHRAVDQQQSESTTPTITGFTDSDWYDVSDSAGTAQQLLVKGLNEGALELKRYDGWSIGMKGGYITAIVKEDPAPTVLDGVNTWGSHLVAAGIGNSYTWTDFLTLNLKGWHLITGNMRITGTDPIAEFLLNGGSTFTGVWWSLGPVYWYKNSDTSLTITGLANITGVPSKISATITNGSATDGFQVVGGWGGLMAIRLAG